MVTTSTNHFGVSSVARYSLFVIIIIIIPFNVLCKSKDYSRTAEARGLSGSIYLTRVQSQFVLVSIEGLALV